MKKGFFNNPPPIKSASPPLVQPADKVLITAPDKAVPISNVSVSSPGCSPPQKKHRKSLSAGIIDHAVEEVEDVDEVKKKDKLGGDIPKECFQTVVVSEKSNNILGKKKVVKRIKGK